MRRYFIDNLRILCILLLFPFHTTMIYNTLDEAFYVQGTPTEVLSFVNFGTYAWWMSGLFVLAGMSTMYAFEHRNGTQYLKERLKKLLIPLVSGIVIIVPMQTYIADKFHNGYQGTYFEHLKVFFQVTDFLGFDGHFTPANLWFILYLLIISVVTLPLLLWYKNSGKKINTKCLTMPVLLLFTIPFGALDYVLSIGSKSFAQFGACFLVGYFIMSQDEIIERLKKNSTWLGITWLTLIIARCIIHSQGYWHTSVNFVAYYSLGWIGILAMIGLGKRFLDHNWKFTKMFVNVEFALFLFHQTLIIMFGYWAVQSIENVYVQYFVIITASFITNYFIYLVCRRFKITRVLFAIKK